MNLLKRAVFEAALSRGKLVQITVIAVPGLDLPVEYRRDGTVLDYGLDLLKPIDDLEANEDGIRATLSLSNEPVATFVPWSAVVKLCSPGLMVVLWPIDVEALAGGKPKLKVVA